MAKQMICEASEFMLPGWAGTVEMPNPPVVRDSGGWEHTGRLIELTPRYTTLISAESEGRFGGVRPDVVACDEEGTLLVEVLVTHAVESGKSALVRASQVRMIEVDLSALREVDVVNYDRLANAVLHDSRNRAWLSNPKAEAAWQAEHDRLTSQVAAVDRDAALRVDTHSRRPASQSTVTAFPLGTKAPPLRTAEIGARLWHVDLGVGRIVRRVSAISPVYEAHFDECGAKMVALEPHGEGVSWRLFDPDL